MASASRSRRGTARPTTHGPGQLTWGGGFLQNTEERRFGAGAPDSPTQGQCANARSNTEWKGVTQEKSASAEKTVKKHNTHLLIQIGIFVRHRWNILGDQPPKEYPRNF